MRALTATTDLWSFFGSYGPDWKRGMLIDHVETFRAAGGTVRTTGSGREWAVRPDGVAFPVVCGYLVEVWTEDGRETGRCGEPVTRRGCCETHALTVEDNLDPYWLTGQSDRDDDAYALHLEASMA